MKKIGLVVKTDPAAIHLADEFETWLQTHDVKVIRRASRALEDSRGANFAEQAPADLFCLFVLGGDGTFLSAVRWVGHQDIPILGIKFGEVGFLAETAAEALFAAARRILKHEFTTRLRMRLQVCVNRKNREVACETVLNDVVINKGALARLAEIKTYINDHYLTTYRADGLIVSTPTGSTAYSLAAGGPVVHPAVPAIVMTPICPFTLTNRPLIVPESACITMRLVKKSSDIRLTFDGQTGREIDAQDIISVRKSNYPIRMVRFPDQQYFDILKAKLRWSGGRV